MTHGDGEDREAQGRADPETACHVQQLRMLLVVQRDHAGLEAHPTDRAASGFGANDLRVHGTHVLGTRRRERDDLRIQGHAALRARARALLTHLRMHGAGVDRPGDRLVPFRSGILRSSLRVAQRQVARRVLLELGHAPARAEQEFGVTVDRAMGSVHRNAHTADGILEFGDLAGVVVTFVVVRHLISPAGGRVRHPALEAPPPPKTRTEGHRWLSA